MTSHYAASNDVARPTTREMFSLSLAKLAPRTNAMSIAWSEAADCLKRMDSAGFDAAMRIFRALEKDPGE